MHNFLLEREVFKSLKNYNKTLAIAESCTAGALSGRLVKANPGISSHFKGGVVVYTLESKELLLSIPRPQIQDHAVVSEFVAREMAIKVKSLLKTDIGFGITGSAGPGVEPDSKMGEFCLAVALEKKFHAFSFHYLTLDRVAFIEKAIDRSLEIILAHVG